MDTISLDGKKVHADARHSQSEQRFNEALTGYEIMEALWSDEKRISSLRDHIVHW